MYSSHSTCTCIRTCVYTCIIAEGFAPLNLFRPRLPERDFFIDNPLVRIQFITVMIRWTGLVPANNRPSPVTNRTCIQPPNPPQLDPAPACNRPPPRHRIRQQPSTPRNREYLGQTGSGTAPPQTPPRALHPTNHPQPPSAPASCIQPSLPSYQPRLPAIAPPQSSTACAFTRTPILSHELHLKPSTPPRAPTAPATNPFFFTLVTGPRRSLRLKLRDTRIYEPQIRTTPPQLHPAPVCNQLKPCDCIRASRQPQRE